MSFANLLLGFTINFAIAFLIVRFIYYPQQRNKNYVFTFLAFNSIIFFVMSFLNSSSISVGVGFGLFAIFSILRYRTDTIPIREMTYLFIITALPLLNSILLSSNSYAELAVTNLAIIAVLFFLEKGWGFQYEIQKTVTYERIEMIRPEKWDELIADLEARTGLKIKRIEIGKLNFLRDSAEIIIFCDSPKNGNKRVRLASNHPQAPSDDD